MLNHKSNNSSVGRQGFLKDNAELIGIAFRFTDLTFIIVGALIAYYLRFDTIELELGYKIALVVVLFGAATFFPLFELYKPWRGFSIWSEIRILILAWVIVAAIVPVLVYLTQTGSFYSHIWFAYWVIVTAVLFVVSRFVTRKMSWWAREKGFNVRNILIVGAGDLGQQVSLNLRQNDWAGINVLGFLDDDPALHGTVVRDVPVVGDIDRINELVGSASDRPRHLNQGEFSIEKVDQIWIALPLSAKNRIREVCRILDDSAIAIIFVPDIFLHGLLNHSVDDLVGMPVVNLRASPIEGTASTLKFVEDIVISSLAILLTAPFMLLIAIGIKLGSPGPILFKQKRYGIDGKEIIVWKFRSMRVMEDGDVVKQATKNDPRVTKLGAILRKTSLDELPQFFNVLQGKMSVVGPRPHAVAHNEQYRRIVARYMWRCKVKPGITGWAQVNGWRGETDVVEKMEKRVEYDLEYLTHWSIWLDIKIVLKTIINGFLNKNAY